MNKVSIILQGIVSVVFLLTSCGAESEFLEASGTLEAVQIRVPSRTAGVALEVPAEEGFQVEAGDLLAVLDDESLRLQRDQVEAGRDMAAAALELVLEGARDEDVVQAREALNAAEERRRLAGEEANRLRALSASGSVSQQQLDRAESAEVQAERSRLQAASLLEKLEAGPREAEIARGRAALEQAEAALALAEKSLEDSRIRSPLKGTVLYRMLDPGEWAAPGMTVFVIADTANLQLTVYVSEPDLAGIRLGQNAEIRMDGSEEVLSGRVSWISPVAEFTPKNVQIKDERVKQVFALRIDVENPDGLLKPGMPADARL
jgi:HlyD family secretion protein